mgnify:CR=1 FL=1
MSQITVGVLILIVVDDGLVPCDIETLTNYGNGLNPYCSGRWSRTLEKMLKQDINEAGLILIVVDDGLVLYLTPNFLQVYFKA